MQNYNGAFAGDITITLPLSTDSETDYVATQQPVVWHIPENISFERAAALAGVSGDVCNVQT